VLAVDDNSYKMKRYPPYFSSPNHLREVSPNNPKKKRQKPSNILPKNIFKNIRPKNIKKKHIPKKSSQQNPSKQFSQQQKCPPQKMAIQTSSPLRVP